MTIDLGILISVAVSALIGGFFAGTLFGDTEAFGDGYREGQRAICDGVRDRMHRIDSDAAIVRYIYEQLEELE
jgi:hypothetical protein